MLRRTAAVRAALLLLAPPLAARGGQRRGSGATGALASLLLVTTTLWSTACIPVRYTEGVSPPLVGRWQRADGAPVAGARLAVLDRQHPVACGVPAASATTDSAGRFRMERTTVERRWLLLFPPIERFGNAYTLCGGASDAVLRVLHLGHGSLDERAPADTIACLTWTFEERERTTCSTRVPGPLAAGGEWTDGISRGYFRVILTEEPTMVKGVRKPLDRWHARVLWMERREGGRDSVRAIAALPLSRRVRWLSSVDIRRDGDRWVAWLHATKSYPLDNGSPAQLAFALGAPGIVGAEEDRTPPPR